MKISWHSLPAGLEAPEEQPTPKFVAEVADRLRAARSKLAGRPIRDVIESVGRVGERFLDESDPIRAEALALLPEASGLSPQMCRVVLDGMARDWTRARLGRVVRLEFGDAYLLDRLEEKGGTLTMAVGGELCVQVVAGSVPGVGVNALLRSLLVKSPVLLKPGHGDVTLSVLFADALRASDPELADAVAVLYWTGGSDSVERAALAHAEVVVAYGGDDSVEALRALTPVTARFIGYHHRVSLAIVGRKAKPAVAHDLARAAAMFDQRGCVSPQLVYVEEGGSNSAADFAASLAQALGELEGELPSAELDVAAAGALQQYRSLAEMRAANGASQVMHGGSEGTWTVIFEAEPSQMPSSPGRAIRVRPVNDLDELGEALAPMSRHLQTVGYAGLGRRASDLATTLGRLGASRVTPVSDMAFPPAWWLHDGRGPLRDLVRWVELE